MSKGKHKVNAGLTFLEEWLEKLPVTSPKVLGGAALFVALGCFLQCRYPFPRFAVFVCLFLFIGLLCLFSERHYCVEMRKIISALLPQECARTANNFMMMPRARPCCFIVFPCVTILIFGIGGCLMFGAIRLTPTLVWILLLFSAVVGTSIVGYLQYVCLAIYVAKLAHGGGQYKNLEKKATGYVPAGISWVQRITKLSHLYRTIFFTVGCTYIIAFAGFCFWPDMAAQVDSPFFYILWGIIFVAIVLTFPVISLCEHKWIKQIVQHLKDSYIRDMENEQTILRKSSSPQWASAVVSISARQIIESKDYPCSSLWGEGYAITMTIVNFIAAITTLFTDTVPFISGLQRFF